MTQIQEWAAKGDAAELAAHGFTCHPSRTVIAEAALRGASPHPPDVRGNACGARFEPDWICQLPQGHYGPCAAFGHGGEFQWPHPIPADPIDRVIVELRATADSATGAPYSGIGLRRSTLRDWADRLENAPHPPADARPWLPIETYPLDSTDYVLLASPAHGRVIGAHVTGEVWHLIGVGAVNSESERPTHWLPLPLGPETR